jgi:hypothetical protein
MESFTSTPQKRYDDTMTENNLSIELAALAKLHLTEEATENISTRKVV